MSVQEVRKKANPESVVVHQKRSQEVIFVPVATHENPIFGVFEGVKNVVKMD